MNGKSISGMFEKLSSGTKAQLEQWLKFSSLRSCSKEDIVPAVKQAKEELVLAGKKVVDKSEPKTDTFKSLMDTVETIDSRDTLNVVRPKIDSTLKVNKYCFKK